MQRLVWGLLNTRFRMKFIKKTKFRMGFIKYKVYNEVY